MTYARTAAAAAVLRCDFPGCLEQHRAPADDQPGGVYDSAQSRGWLILPGRDLCPFHARPAAAVTHDARLLRLIHQQLAAADQAARWIVAHQPVDSQPDQVAAAWLQAAAAVAALLDLPGPTAATARLDAPFA